MIAIRLSTWALLVLAVCSVGLAGSLPTPNASLIVRGYGWVVLYTGFDVILALGFASLVGSRAVTNGEYREFVEAGGYREARHWLADGWHACRARGWEAPLYWEKSEGGWCETSGAPGSDGRTPR